MSTQCPVLHNINSSLPHIALMKPFILVTNVIILLSFFLSLFQLHAAGAQCVCVTIIKNVYHLSKQRPDKPVVLIGYQSLKFSEEGKAYQVPHSGCG